jgi:peptide/nickel transport system permease protein
MRVLDIIYAVPVILLAIAIIASFGASVPTIILSISIYGIPVYARIVRAQVMTLSEAEYVEAAKASGATDSVIILKHIIPNSLAPVIVRATLEIGTAILTTSALSYLGVGIPSHIPEWGNLLNVGSQFLEAYPYMAIFPGIAIVALVLSFNFFGDGLRDALDPKMK